MRYSFKEIRVGRDTILLGRHFLFAALPRSLRSPIGIDGIFRHAISDQDACSALRSFVVEEGLAGLNANFSAYEIVQIVGRQLDSGQITAVLLRETNAIRMPSGPVAGRKSASDHPHAQKSVLSSKAPLQATQLGAIGLQNHATSSSLAPPTSGVPKPINGWTAEERISAVIRKAVAKVPADVGRTLLDLLSPDSLALVASFVAVSVAANMTPYGWAADAVIAGVAFAFGGIAALHALRDLAECFTKVSTARSEQDLDQAADSLARAVVTIGVIGLMAILHRIGSRRGGGGGSSPKAEEPTIGQAPSRGSSNSRLKTSEEPKPSTRNLSEDQFHEKETYHRAKSKAESYSGHGHGRHGSQTSIAEQTQRVQTGQAPDGNVAPTSKATKFDSHAKEVEAIERARAANPGAGKPKFRSDGKPNRDIKVVDDGPEGYGRGVEVQTGSDGKPLPGRPVQITGPQPNAKVIYEYNPRTDSWDPLTHYPTNEPATP
jgi:hypothetical protein